MGSGFFLRSKKWGRKFVKNWKIRQKLKMSKNLLKGGFTDGGKIRFWRKKFNFFVFLNNLILNKEYEKMRKNLHMYGNIYRVVQKNRNFETFDGHLFRKQIGVKNPVFCHFKGLLWVKKFFWRQNRVFQLFLPLEMMFLEKKFSKKWPSKISKWRFFCTTLY